MRIAMRACLATLLVAMTLVARAQASEGRSIEHRGQVIEYLYIAHAADALRTVGDGPRAPDSPISTFQLIGRHLVAGDIEEAALLSNEPKRRYEVLRDYRESVGTEEFRKVYASYFDPGNRVVGEARIGDHSVLVVQLASQKRLAGQYYARVEDRWLTDDVPTETRLKLRWVLEHLRREAAAPAGKD